MKTKIAAGALGLIGVVGIILAIFTSIGAGWPIIALILAAVCFWMFRRTVN